MTCFLLNCYHYHWWNDVNWIDVGQLVFSGLTLWLAYLIYKNFEIKKHFLLKQVEIVYDISNKLEKAFIIIQCKIEGSEFAGESSGFHVSSINLIKSRNQRFLHIENTFVNGRFFEEFEVLQYASNSFTPEPIQKALLKFFCQQGTQTVDLNNYRTYAIITAARLNVDGSNSSNPNENISISKCVTDGNIYQNVDVFLNHILLLKREIKKWLAQFDVKLSVVEP